MNNNSNHVFFDEIHNYFEKNDIEQQRIISKIQKILNSGRKSKSPNIIHVHSIKKHFRLVENKRWKMFFSLIEIDNHILRIMFTDTYRDPEINTEILVGIIDRAVLDYYVDAYSLSSREQLDFSRYL